MFGLTTIRRLRQEIDAHLGTIRLLDTAERLTVQAYSQVITEQARAEQDHLHFRARLTRALRACARYRTQLPRPHAVQHPDELWSLIDWSLWGSGMGDTFRERLADQFLAAITTEQHDQALRLIQAWTDSGHSPLGRRRYEDQQRRLHRALRSVAYWRAQAAAEHREAQRRTASKDHRVIQVLAEQLLTATSGHSPAARHALGLPKHGAWQRAVEGLNALVDAGEVFHIEPDGHISNPSGDEHIEWDRAANRWHLAHGDQEAEAA
ncbi:hypothetical protein [Streptomyces chryseus]